MHISQRITLMSVSLALINKRSWHMPQQCEIDT
jgi:hypothetical protein